MHFRSFTQGLALFSALTIATAAVAAPRAATATGGKGAGVPQAVATGPQTQRVGDRQGDVALPQLVLAPQEPGVEFAPPEVRQSLANPESAAVAPRVGQRLSLDDLLASTTLLNEGFEGTWPNGTWQVAISSGYVNAYWGKSSYRKASGSYSIWCAKAGTQASADGQNVPANMKAWAFVGPFDLSGATSGQLAFDLWMQTEATNDLFKICASVDGQQYYCYYTDQNTSGFEHVTPLDLSNWGSTLGSLLGRSAVWFAFIYQTNSYIQYEGAYIDNVSLTTGGGGSTSCGTYVITADNDDNNWSGSPDGDWGYCLFNTDAKHPIEFHIDITETSINAAQLLLLCNDVDWATIANQPEVDKVYINSHYLGDLTGANNQDSTTVFNVPASYLVAGGRNRVWINVNTDSRSTPDMWCVELKQAQLVINGGCKGNASCRSVTTDKGSYTPGQTINATVEVDTALSSQQVRVEVDLVDSTGKVLDGKELDYTTNGSANDPKNVALTVPSGLANGTYSVEALVFDAGTKQLESTCKVQITVTGGGSTGCGTYVISADNDDNNWSGSPDGDWGYCLFNTDAKHPIEFHIDITETSIGTAQLLLLCNDVDWATIANQPEVDKVYMNSHYLGDLTGANNQDSTTVFNVPPSYLVAGGRNRVWINVNTDSRSTPDMWCVELKQAQLVINGGCKGNASCRSVTTDKGSYTPGQTINATVEVDTALSSQQVRVEVDLVDSTGKVLDGKELDYTTNGSANDPKNVALTVPSGLASGSYTVEAFVFDATTKQLESTCRVQVTVTGGGTACNLTCSANVPTTGQVNVAVNVTSTADTTGCTGTPEYHWQFSDTTALYTAQNMSHTFTAAGVYNWNLWVHLGTQDCYKNGTITITGGGGNCTLSCSATVPTTGQVNQSVSFQGSATPSNCGSATVTYAWDYGDMTAMGSGQNVTHSYAAAGTYNWQMTALVAGVYCVKNGTITISSGGGPCGGCAATRTLPGAYAAGQALQVTIQTCPPTSNNHALEDVPPSGWTVSGIDNGGTYDSTNGKVKWGPFFDTQQRTLHYSVTPPSGTTGTKNFQGVISIDGVSQAICGTSSISPGSYHPADTNTNWRIDINEATAYGAAWKQGTTWPKPPNPIPIDYVTNAGYLWKSGETYHYDGTKTPPWAPGSSPASPAGTVACGRGATTLGAGSTIAGFGAATYASGVPLQVTISVMPAASTSVYAVEDAPPAGWVTSGIDNGGQFDAGTGKVKWGPFFDNQNRTLNYTVTPASGDSCPKTFVGVGSFDGSNFPIAGARTISSSVGGCAYSYWVPVVSHVDVPSKSAYYRSDTGVLNLAFTPANITLRLYTGTTVLSMSSNVSGNGQQIFQDIAGTLGFTTGSGALEVRSDQPLVVTSRTYNQEQGTGKTYGQGYDGITSAQVLTAGQSALLPQLIQNGTSGQSGTYRTNIGITNTGSTAASVTVTIFDQIGNLLWSDTRSYDPGIFYQYQEPFRTGAGHTDIAKGYARITVNSGSGVVAYASVLDNASSDPTTINIFAAASGGAPPYVYWVPVVSHVDVPSKSAYYRSDTGLLNLASATANVTVQLYTGSSVLSLSRSVSAVGQEILQDIAGLMGFTTGSGALQVSSDQPLIVTSRTYNQEQGTGKTYGQGYDGITSAQGLGASQSALLPQLTQNGTSGQSGTYRTNIGITNTGTTAASVTLTIYDADGTQLWTDTRSYDPGAFYQYQEPFRTGAGRTDIAKGYARITVNSGSGIVSYASVLDNASSDPTTWNMKR